MIFPFSYVYNTHISLSLSLSLSQVDSFVKLQIAKSSSGETLEFVMRREDSRQVEKVKDVYAKLSELGTAAKAPTPEIILKNYH